MQESKYYWIKSTGEVIEIDRDKFLEYDKKNMYRKNKRRLIWKAGNDVSFVHIDNWVSIDVIKEIIN